MSNEEYARLKRLSRRAGYHGMSIHHCREGFYFIIDDSNAVWSRYGSFQPTLDDIEKILDITDKGDK